MMTHWAPRPSAAEAGRDGWAASIVRHFVCKLEVSSFDASTVWVSCGHARDRFTNRRQLDETVRVDRRGGLGHCQDDPDLPCPFSLFIREDSAEAWRLPAAEIGLLPATHSDDEGYRLGVIQCSGPPVTDAAQPVGLSGNPAAGCGPVAVAVLDGLAEEVP